jgi:hypothetical protein
MITRTPWAHLSRFALILTPLLATTAFALPGEAVAVIAHCGQPTTESQEVSPVTGLTQRDLTYNNVILHFESMEGGWSFTTAWKGHLPVSRTKLETEMPCFRDAMHEVAARPTKTPDPTIAADHSVPQVGIHFGPVFLWLIFGLAVILVVFLALPTTRRRYTKARPAIARRKPRALSVPFRRKPRGPKLTDL